jgi:D-alanyl-D-alanine carboxypeptidase
MTFNLGRAVRRSLAAFFSAPFILCAQAQAAPSVVIDVASGQILQQEQPTASWYPASLTKLMTVYVALDAVRAKRLSFDTPLIVSPRAYRMAPSKMGFRPGSEVTLGNALVMLMVKSANDIAVAIAEGVSGSVETFAEDMNKASASLGMRESYWVNPNGLPDERQVTSARDLAILGRALYLQFPEHANLFSVGAMQLGKSIIPTHNGLLGRYPGADGMKTGFTCSAGFNLVASASRGGRRLIAVVLGAPSATVRTAKAAALLDRGFMTGGAMGSIDALQTFGVAAAPDMHDGACRNRGKASAKFMAEVEDLTVPIGSGSTGVPLLDALGGGQPQTRHVNPKDVARLPRPQFEPVKVFVGRAPGYEGPVARPRAPGEPVGAGPEITAYTNEKEDEAGATPISRAAPDAASLRRHGKHGKRFDAVKHAQHNDAAGKAGSKARGNKNHVASKDDKKASHTDKKHSHQPSAKVNSPRHAAAHAHSNARAEQASGKKTGKKD